ncbi:hypothetical protein [Bdellovibrio sp. HCB288]|uniref:hypothetical protein n=1 Tax=Bdellovibrio sp. HCB288 TaxID=3394355 RepID=UPI0039B56BAB
MKLAEIIKVIAQELGSSDLKEINKLLKKDPGIKFRITGKALGHFGFTGQIKGLSEEGVKAFMANKVSLIRLDDIETFGKAKPREERPVRTAPKAEKVPAVKPAAVKKAKAAAKPAMAELEDDTDFDDDFGDEDLRAKKIKKGQPKAAGKSGSRFIPTSKK